MADEKATPVTLDFTNVKDQGKYNPKHVTAGDYRATIISVESTKSSKDNPMWVYGIQLNTMKSAVYPERIVLQENSLWKLRNLLAAAGLKVPKKRVKVDPNKVVGKEIGITLEDDEYEGKMKSVVAAVFPVDELTGDSPEDDSDEDTEDTADTEDTDSDDDSSDDDDLDDIEVDEL